VKDVIAVISWMMQEMLTGKWLPANNGLYNLGTGKARTFYGLAKATFAAINQSSNIQFIDMPTDISDKYQYFTEANMQKLKQAGYHQPLYILEEGVDDYVRNYLVNGKYF
jgi:ADP-L-glycero-D-manno-heptose 6-epimerase